MGAVNKTMLSGTHKIAEDCSVISIPGTDTCQEQIEESPCVATGMVFL